MLNAKSIRNVRGVVKSSNRLKAILFDWDPAGCKLIVTRGLKQRIYFTIIALYLAAEAIYQGCTLYSESYVRTISLESFMKLVSHFFTRLSGLFVTLVNAYNVESVTTFFNQMLQMDRRFSVYLRGQKAVDKGTRFLWIFKYFLYLQPLLPAFTYANEHDDIRYWHGAVFPGFILRFIWPFFFVVEYWISFYVVSGPIFWGYITCPYCFYTPAWMNVLRLKLRYVDLFEWHRRRVRNGSCTLYKGLQILTKMYNCCYANMLGAGLAACMACLVLMLTLSIQLTPKIEFPGCLIFPVGAYGSLLIPRSGLSPTVKVAEASMAFVESYRLTRNPVQLRAARSLMPLIVHVSVFCEMSRPTLVEFYSSVINNTVSMLLI